MSYTVLGQLVDSGNSPIEFARVYVSDANGKPTGKNSETDLQGRWKLDGVKDTDYITGTRVGYNKKTIPAKTIIPIPNFITGISQRMIRITLPEDSKLATLGEVNVESTKITKKKSNVGKYVIIGGVGLLLIASTLLILKNKKII